MKKYLVLLLSVLLSINIGITAFAEIIVMSDGGKFDPKYYAETYPDVAELIGTDTEALYEHYLNFGIYEGRSPYKNAPYVKLDEKKPSATPTNDAAPKKDVPAQSDVTANDSVTEPVPSENKILIDSTITDGRIRKCAVITGDSRTVALMSMLLLDSSWKKTYYAIDGIGSTCILYKNDVILVMSGEAGGNYVNGAYDRAFARVNALLNTRKELANCSTYKVLNLFCVNDLLVNEVKSGAPYIKADEAVIAMLPRCDVFYQFNAGPISPEGGEYLHTTNEMIEKYNADMLKVQTSSVCVVDFYQYLVSSGFNVILDASDMSGVHYDEETNKKIIAYLLSMI